MTVISQLIDCTDERVEVLTGVWHIVWLTGAARLYFVCVCVCVCVNLSWMCCVCNVTVSRLVSINDGGMGGHSL